MSDQTGETGDETFGDEPLPASGPRMPDARPPWSRRKAGDEEVRHSALVGFMSVPVHRRFPIRRSTLVMAVAFVGLGALLYFYPAQSDASTGSGAYVNGPNGTTVWVPNASPVSTTTSTTTTTRPPTTTTTAPRPTTTTTTTAGPSTTTTVRGATTTTAAGGFGASTTTVPGGTQTPGNGTIGTSRSTTTTTRPTGFTTTSTTIP